MVEHPGDLPGRRVGRGPRGGKKYAHVASCWPAGSYLFATWFVRRSGRPPRGAARGGLAIAARDRDHRDARVHGIVGRGCVSLLTDFDSSLKNFDNEILFVTRRGAARRAFLTYDENSVLAICRRPPRIAPDRHFRKTLNITNFRKTATEHVRKSDRE